MVTRPWGTHLPPTVSSRNIHPVPESIANRIAAIDGQIADAAPLGRLHVNEELMEHRLQRPCSKGKRRGTSMNVRVAELPGPWSPIPPILYGGVETLVDKLSVTLEAEGHEVVPYTTGDSTCRCAVDRCFLKPRVLA